MPTRRESNTIGTERRNVHLPDVIVPEQCVERCGGLKKRLGEVSLAALHDPDGQYVVICDKARILGCNAIAEREGDYTIIEGQEAFFGEVTSWSGGRMHGTVMDTMERALEKGAVNVPFDSVG